MFSSSSKYTKATELAGNFSKAIAIENRLEEQQLVEIIEEADDETLSEALRININDHGETPMHLATLYLSQALLAIINKVSDNTLSTASLSVTKNNNTPLHLAVGNSNQFVFRRLIDRLSPKTLSDGLKIKNDGGMTPLHYAAKNENPGAILAIVGKLSREALSAALQITDRYWNTPLHIAASNSNQSAFLSIISKLSPEALSAAVKIKNKIWETPLDLSPCKKVLIESAFDSSNTKIHRMLFSNIVAASLCPEIWKRIKKGAILLPDLRLRMQLVTVLMNKRAYSLTQDEINFFLYLKKTTDAKPEYIDLLVSRHLSNSSASSWLASRDTSQDTKYKNALETPKDDIPDDPILNEADKIYNRILKNEIIIKIVAPARYDDYLHQLQDYTYRPKIREDKSNAKYKLVHMSGEVVSYQYHQHPKNKPTYEHTKKSSATLIGENLQTPVFGHHDGRALVGYLFDKNQCIIKAMFKQDKGTYAHQWLANTEAEAKSAASLVPNYNFTDEQAFLEQVNSDSELTNEVLVKVKREAIVAIVVARMDDESISIAKKRQQESLDKLGVNVPIVFYDFKNNSLEMIQDRLKKEPDAGPSNKNSGGTLDV